MNRTSFFALCIALLIPLGSYLAVRYASKDAVIIPRTYIPDTIKTRIENGKVSSDTAWHVVKDIRLVNQLGDTVNLYDIKGKAIVIDYFFTSCGSICPAMTHNMSRLQQSFIHGGKNRRNKIDTSIVQFVSFTVDPERDSVQRLKEYSDRFGVNHSNWWLLTGDRKTIYNYAFDELKVDQFSEEPISPDFVHTNRFVLIDKNHYIRGYYDGLDTASLSHLARDIGILLLEKDKNTKLPFDPLLMGVFFAITIIVVSFSIWLIFKK